MLKKPLPDRVIRRIAARAELPALCVFYIACLLLVSSPRGPTGDAFDYSILTQSLVDDHSWEASPSVGADPKNMVRAPDGRTYSFFPAGQSLILVPFYFFGTVASAWARAENQPMIELLSWHLAPAALTALTGALLCSFLMTRFGFAKALAFFVSALYVFATMALPYSKIHYSEPLLALLVLWAAHALTSPLSPRSLPFLSAAIGAMVLTKPAFVLLAPVFVALFLWNRNGRGSTFQDVAWAALAAAPFALVFCYWNFIRTGSMWDIGGSAPVMAQNQFSLRYLPESLRVLIGTKRNPVLFNPVLALALVGLFLSPDRQYRRVALGLFAAQTVAFGVFAAATSQGAWAWGPRYAMPFLILFVPFVAVCLSQAWHSRVRWLASAGSGLVIAISLYVQFLAVSFHFSSEYHVCARYREVVSALPEEFPDARPCNALSDAIHIRHYMAWQVSPESITSGNVREFPWIERKHTVPLARLVFDSRLAGDVVGKDYLFFSTSTRDRNAAVFLSRIRMLLVSIAGLSLSILGVCLACFGKVRTCGLQAPL